MTALTAVLVLWYAIAEWCTWLYGFHLNRPAMGWVLGLVLPFGLGMLVLYRMGPKERRA